MTKLAIQPRHIGYSWTAAGAVGPRILSVTRSICEAGYSGQCQSTGWILDYSFTPFGRWRAGSANAAWLERPAFEAHLYAPRTPYWEDTGSAGVARTRGVFISFCGGEKVLPSTLLRQQVIRFLDPDQKMGHLLERLLELGLGMGDAGFANAQAVFWEIIALLNAATAHGDSRLIPSGDTAAPVADFLQAARTYFHEHLAEHITRQALARHLKLSVSTLAHRYQAETGEAPRTTLNRMRIHVAKNLLLKGYPLKTIAAQTGFYDEYHLSRTFKRLEGITPRDFRRRQAQGAGPAKLLL